MVLDQATAAELTGSDDDSSLGGHSWRHIIEILNQEQWNISRAARALGIHRSTLYRKISRQKFSSNLRNGNGKIQSDTATLDCRGLRQNQRYRLHK
jgi:IS30 family transposase